MISIHLAESHKTFLVWSLVCTSDLLKSLEVFTQSFGVMYILKVTIGIRVTEEEELKGLDIAEHEMAAYQELETRPTFDLVVK